MPKFIDHHEMRDVAPEMAAGIAERIKAGDPDEHGVKGLNVFIGKDGTAFCLSEAPDADAVIKAHESYGFSLDRSDVVEVESVV
jgi:Nickel responsive protein SCO4226-like